MNKSSGAAKPTQQDKTMSLKGLITTLTLSLILIGFLVNSVVMRLLGNVEGNVYYPIFILSCLLALSLLLGKCIVEELNDNSKPILET